MVHTLGQQLCKLLVVEDLEWAARWNLAHGGGVEAMVVVTVTRLDEDGRVREALCIHLSAHIVEVDSWWMKMERWATFLLSFSSIHCSLSPFFSLSSYNLFSTLPLSLLPPSLSLSPLPMCLLVFSMVELRFTLESNPRQKRSELLLGSVKPSTMTECVCAWNTSPTLLLSS